MNLSKIVVPRAAPFVLGHWNGRELLIELRRWMPAVVCWILAGVVVLWVAIGVAFPKSDYVPEREQFGAFIAVSIGLTGVGLLLVIWKRWWRVMPSENVIEFGTGFFKGSGRRTRASDHLWIQVHPIEITVRVKGTAVWAGSAVVIHCTEAEGVVVAVERDAAEAAERSVRLGMELGLASAEEPGVPLKGRM